MAKVLKLFAVLAAAAAFLAVGFEMGARSVKFSPASAVEFSGILVGNKADNSPRSM